MRPKRRDDHGPAEVDPLGYLASLTQFALGAGLDRVGVCSADVLTDTRRILHERREAGLHDTMQFTYRDPDRSTDPRRAVAGARAVIVGARSYLEPDDPMPGDPMPDDTVPGDGTQTGSLTFSAAPSGRVARYARDDHYAPLRAALWAVAHRLRADGYRAVAFADDNSMVDRAVAHRAGIGWFGKNANLLLPGAGSWFVLGSVVTDAPLPAAAEPVADGCGTCVRCLEGCPTGAIVAPGVVDARRCLSWLLQKPGDFPEEFREALGDRIYGCDDCQEVCPPTVRLGHRVTRRAPDGDVLRRDAADRSRPRVAGGAQSVPEGGHLDRVPLLDMLASSDEELLATYGRWYLADRDPRWWRRNALVVLGNVADPADGRVRDVLHHYRQGIDDVLASHAAWALARLDRRSAETP